MGPRWLVPSPCAARGYIFHDAQDADTHQGCPLLLHEGHESCKGAPSPRAVHFLALNVQLQRWWFLSQAPLLPLWYGQLMSMGTAFRPALYGRQGFSWVRHPRATITWRVDRGASSEMSRPHVCVPRPWGHLTPPGPYKRGMQARPSVPLRARVVQRSHGLAKSGWVRGLEFR